MKPILKTLRTLIINHFTRKCVVTMSAASLALLVGCSKEEPAPVAPPPAPAVSIDTSGAGTESGAAPAPVAPAEPVRALNPDNKSGIQTVDADGKQLDTIAGLERAVEYYQRVLMPRAPVDEEEEKTFKPTPPLKDLQQLVEWRVIRAVPEAPPGQKYVYDAESGKVKLVTQ